MSHNEGHMLTVRTENFRLSVSNKQMDAVETHSIMKVFDGELGETRFNQVQFTFRCNCFEPEQTETCSGAL